MIREKKGERGVHAILETLYQIVVNMFCMFTETVSEPSPQEELDSNTESQIKSRGTDGE